VAGEDDADDSVAGEGLADSEAAEESAVVYGDNAYGTGPMHERLEQAGLPVLAGEFVAITVLSVLIGGVIAAIFLQNILFIMLIAVVIFLPIVLAYTAWVYRVLHGKITPKMFETNRQAY